MTRRQVMRSGREPFPSRRLFFTCWLIYAVHFAPFMIREQFPAVTLATHGTLNVERFLGWSPDIFPGPNGGALINNNPGASIVGAVPLLLARPLLTAIEKWNDHLSSSAVLQQRPEFAASSAVQHQREWYFMAVAFFTATGLMAPVSSLAVSLLGWTLWSGGLPRGQALIAALTLGFATPIFVRTGYLNHNLLVCHAGLLAALLLWQGGRTLAMGPVVAAGALGGFAVLCDYSGLLVLLAGGIYAWLRGGDEQPGLQRRLRVAAGYAAGAAPMLLALALYQRWAFGTSALPSQHFMPAIEETTRGYRGMDWPSFELFMMNFFDTRFGLFVVCPLLLLSLAAPFVRRGRFRLPDREMWLALGLFVGFTLFCAANQYSRLQYTTGIRYMVPVIPGLVLLSLQVLAVLPGLVQRTAIAVSIGLGWLQAITHRSLAVFADGPGEWQLSWVRRMAEYNAIRHPAVITMAVLVATAAVVVVLWREEMRPPNPGLQSHKPVRGLEEMV